MGFFTFRIPTGSKLGCLLSQSLSGWDGVFHATPTSDDGQEGWSRRNPFQGGMGFFTG